MNQNFDLEQKKDDNSSILKLFNSYIWQHPDELRQKIIQKLKENEPNALDSNDKTYLDYALEAKPLGVLDLDLIKLLLDNGASIYQDNKKVQHNHHKDCQDHDFQEIFGFLEQANCSFNPCAPILHNLQDYLMAILGNNPSYELTEYLVSLPNFNIEHRDYVQCTYLHKAFGCPTYNSKIIELLINKKCDIHARDGSGEHCLHKAATFGTIEHIQYLIQQKAEPEIIKTNKGENCLLTACQYSDDTRLPILSYLIDELGLDVNSSNKKSETCLHYVCMQEDEPNLKLAKLLLEKGADPNRKNQDEGSDIYILPLCGAIYGGYVGFIRLLLQYGAQTEKLTDYNQILLNDTVECQSYFNLILLLIFLNELPENGLDNLLEELELEEKDKEEYLKNNPCAELLNYLIHHDRNLSQTRALLFQGMKKHFKLIDYFSLLPENEQKRITAWLMMAKRIETLHLRPRFPKPLQQIIAQESCANQTIVLALLEKWYNDKKVDKEELAQKLLQPLFNLVKHQRNTMDVEQNSRKRSFEQISN